jgi:hypothetical protein
MQKVVQILEKNVEWIALALGVGFLGYMVWLYILNPPVVATIGQDHVTPASVDDYILNGPVQTLKQRMDNPPIPKFQVQDFSKLIPDALDPAPVIGPSLAGAWDFSPAVLPSNISQPTNQGPKVAGLPQLPAAQPLVVIAGQSSIVSFAAAAQAIPPVNPANPANPAPANPAAPAQPPPAARTDVHWVTAAFTIPMGPLSAQWTKAFGAPPGPNQQPGLAAAPSNTFILDVTAYRNELLPNGQWGPDQLVARMPNDPVNMMPKNVANNRVAGHQYLIWAQPHFADIATPKFPDLAPAPAGTAWQDPSAVIKGMIGAPGAAAGQAAPGAAGTPAPAPAPSSDPSLKIITPPNMPLPTVAPVPPTDTISPTAPATGGAPTPDLLIYVNDLVDPGKTYQYKIVYSLANPVFDLSANRVANPTWAGQLALTAPMSAPSPQVSVGPQTYFYCAAGGPQNGKFLFDVFTWAAGLWQGHQFSLSPGDAIGGMLNGVDFSTGNTYVDIKTRLSDNYITVVDDSGAAKVLRATQDLNSPDHKLKIQWVTQATTAPSPNQDNSNGNGNNNTDQ